MSEQNENIVEQEAPEAAETNVATDDQLASLRAQLEEARRVQEAEVERGQRLIAERDAARQEAQAAVDHRFYAEDVAVANAIAAAQNEVAQSKAQMAQLSADGKFAEAAEEAERIADAKVRLRQAEGRQQWIAQEKQRAKERQEEIAKAPQEDVTYRQPQTQITQRTQQWIDAHPRFLTDEAYRDIAMNAHNIALRKNIPADTDEYFSFIERMTGDREEEDPGERVVPQRRDNSQISSAAPPSRGSANPTRTKSETMRLTAQEREVADATLFMVKDPAERYKKFAENMAKAKAEGRLMQ